MAIIESAYSNEVSATPVSLTKTFYYAHRQAGAVYRLDGSTWTSIYTPPSPYVIFGMDFDSVADKLVILLYNTTSDSLVVVCEPDGSNAVSHVTTSNDAGMSLDTLRGRAIQRSGTNDYRATPYAGGGSLFYTHTRASRITGYDPQTDRFFFGGGSGTPNLYRLNGDATNLVAVGGSYSAGIGQCRPHYNASRVFIVQHPTNTLFRLISEDNSSNTFEGIYTAFRVKGLEIDRDEQRLYCITGNNSVDGYSLKELDYTGSVLGTIAGPWTTAIATSDQIYITIRYS
jgi:hypothetical protein